MYFKKLSGPAPHLEKNIWPAGPIGWAPLESKEMSITDSMFESIV